MICGIYMIRNKANGKSYIGSSNDIDRRWRSHISKLNKGCHINRYLQRSWNKYGRASFMFTVLEICEADVLLQREQWYLDTLHPEFNIASDTSAPMKDKTHAPETCRKISLALQGNTYSIGHRHSDLTRERMSLAHKDKPQAGGVKSHTGESKQKISNALRGRKKSEDSRRKMSKAKEKPVAQLDTLTGNVIRIWPSQTVAAKDFGIDQRSISEVCRGRVRFIKGRPYIAKTAGGYGWRFAKNSEDK